MKKKNVILAIIGAAILLSTAILGISFYFLSSGPEKTANSAESSLNKADSLDTLIHNQKKELEKKFKKIYVKKQDNLYYFIPQDMQGKNNENIEKKLISLATTTNKDKNKSSATIRLFYPEKSSLSFTNLENIIFHTRTYSKKTAHSVKLVQKSQLDPQTYHSDSLQPLNFSDLFLDDTTFKEASAKLEYKLYQQNNTHPDILAQLVNFSPRAMLPQATLTLSDTDLTIANLPSSGSSSAITFPLSEWASELRPEFIPSGATPSASIPPLTPDYIALTFDDGPNPTTTPQVLKILADNGVPATFFMLGQMIDAYPQIAKAVKDAGHQIGSHTYSHSNLNSLSPDGVQSEFNRTNAALYKAAGIFPTTVRPPYGAINSQSDQNILEPIIQWSVDSQDWKSKNAGAIISRINATTYGGSIILMHDIQPATVAALPTVIQNLKNRGLKFATVSQLLGSSLHPSNQYFGLGDQRPIK